MVVIVAVFAPTVGMNIQSFKTQLFELFKLFCPFVKCGIQNFVYAVFVIKLRLFVDFRVDFMMQNGSTDYILYVWIFSDFIIKGNKLICFDKIIAIVFCNGVVIAFFVKCKSDFAFIRKLAE